MTDNYFAIERNGKSIDHVYIRREDGTIVFEDIMNMSYEEMKSYKDIDAFVACVMDITNIYFNESDEQTLITLIDKDDVFIWGVVVGPGENEDQLNYAFIDWRKDGKSYRYEKN